MKRGMSSLIASILLVLVVIVGVAIIWTSVRPLISNSLQSNQACANVKISINIEQGYTCYDSDADKLNVMVSHKSNEELAGINIIVSGDGKSNSWTLEKGKTYPNAIMHSGSLAMIMPLLNEEKTFTLDLSTFGTPEIAKVAPIIKIGRTLKKCPVSSTTALPECINKTIKKCSDNTLYSTCSTNKPYFCDNGKLINNCMLCNCISGQSCNSTSNACYASVEEEHPFGFAGPWQPDNYTKMAEIGTDYVRSDISWHVVETSNDNFDFSGVGSGYDALRDNFGIGLIVRLKMRESWATYCDTVNITCPAGFDTCPRSSADCPPKELGEWNNKYGYSELLYDFVYKTLEYMHNTNRPVEYLVTGNEANTLTFWHGTSEDYFKTRGTIYKAVKDINEKYNENTKVVDNGFAGSVWGYALIRDEACSGDFQRIAYAKEFIFRYFGRTYTQLQIQDSLDNTLNLPYFCENPDRSQIILRDAFKVDDNLGVPSFDYMAYHFYEPWNTQEEIINWIRAEMLKNGYSRPIMHTEGGYYDRLRLLNSSFVDEVRQDVAEDIPKLHAVAFANGVKTWLWLPFTERYYTEHYGPQWSGIVSPEPELMELPAFTSYKTMTSKIDGFASVEKKNFGGDYVYKFIVGIEPVYVVWSNISKTINFNSEISGNALVTRIDGTTEIVASNALQISESPIYVESV